MELRWGTAGRTVRFLSGILARKGVTVAHIRDLLPRFIDYVVWRKGGEDDAPEDVLEVALFEQPFRGEDGRPLTEVVVDLGPTGSSNGKGDPTGCEPEATESPTSGPNGAARGSGGYGFANGYGMGSLGGRNTGRIEPAHGDHAYGW